MNNRQKFWLVMAIVFAIIFVFSAFTVVSGHPHPDPELELQLGARPLTYLELGGRSCKMGVLPGFYDSFYPDKWFCHGWTSCEPYWFPHEFSLSGGAHVETTESRPGIACGEPEDHTLYLSEGMVTFLDHEIFLPVVSND